jgi:septum site-determining protein MinC
MTAQTLGLGTRLPTPHPNRKARPLIPNIHIEEAILVQRTLRSGFKLEHPAHIIVIGDVNPGAEVISGGSIVVWGRLRGVAHAGAEGDENAYVCALELSPPNCALLVELQSLLNKEQLLSRKLLILEMVK